MSDAKLADRGWIEEEVDPGNCVEERWRKGGVGLEATIAKRKDGGIEGVIRAIEDMADAKKKGELVLKEFEDLDEGAATIEQLMAAFALEPPHREEPDTTPRLHVISPGE